MIVYNYIYIKIYQFFRLINEDIPDFLATMAMSWLFFFNIISIKVYLELSGKVFDYNKEMFIIFVVSILVIHYLLFSFNDRYETILVKFKNEKKAIKIIGSVLVLGYVLLSSYLFFYFAIPNTKIVPR